jgi:L-fuconolactonase
MSLDITGKYRYPEPRPTWLDLTDEPILEPQMAIVDAHHHLWEQEGNQYLLNELEADLAVGHRVVATVCVEAKYHYKHDGPEHLRCTGETGQFKAIRESASSRKLKTDIARGVVAFADLTLGKEVKATLDAHRNILGEQFKGIRHSIARDENFPNGIVIRPAVADLLLRSDYQQGLRELKRQGLVYDAMLYHQQIPQLSKMAEINPNLQVVLNHYGCMLGIGVYRSRSRECFDEWKRDILELAERDNVAIKLGGLGMIITGANWHNREKPPSSEELAQAWKPYFDTCLNAFGPDRCLFESNFPVDKGMYSYKIFWNACKRLAHGLSPDEKSRIFFGTANEIYSLQL